MSNPWESRISERAPVSKKIHDLAKRVLAGGMSHEMRHSRPFSLAIERAHGSRKWDPDGNEYVDFVIGHGALLLGHGHPAVVEAVREQVGLGTHYGAAHESEVKWAELVCDLVPSAERVRFTSSGTEAVILAARVARAFTGRSKIMKFHSHFHGWSEFGLAGLSEPFDVPVSPGFPESVLRDIVVVPPEEEAVQQALDADVAAVILEPTGAHFGAVPLVAGFLAFLREATTQNGSLLIFDEVITGFRWARGGVQELLGITPDVTTLAKILGGGLPAGAVAGGTEVMEGFEIRDDPNWDRYRRLFHPGTYNANPLSAAAGVTTLKIVATGEPIAAADATAETIRRALAAVLERRGVAGEVFGESSTFHIELAPGNGDQELRRKLSLALRSAMVSHGIDMGSMGGMVSIAHNADDVELTTSAFDRALGDLLGAGVIGTGRRRRQ